MFDSTLCKIFHQEKISLLDVGLPLIMIIMMGSMLFYTMYSGGYDVEAYGYQFNSSTLKHAHVDWSINAIFSWHSLHIMYLGLTYIAMLLGGVAFFVIVFIGIPAGIMWLTFKSGVIEKIGTTLYKFIKYTDNIEIAHCPNKKK
jgi:hypothetical protein